MERPQEALRYFARYSVFLMASMTALSTSFWSAALEAGKAWGAEQAGVPREPGA